MKYIIINIKIIPENYLIMGDFNAKNEIFNCKYTNRNGELLNQILAGTNSQILNETFDPTFHILREKGEDYEEFLDVFLGSSLIACKA